MIPRLPACGIWGIDEELAIYEGYDNEVHLDLDFDNGEEINWTPEQKRELADLMIGRWQQFKDAAGDAK